MRFDIHKVPAHELSVSDFVARYYETEQPVLLTGLAAPCESDSAKVVWGLAHEPEAEWSNGHIAAGTIDGDGLLRVPDLVHAIFSGQEIVHKPKPLKLWMQPQGHRSVLHYDGNSLHGLNWQVAGRKKWQLISPRTPVRMVPFSWVAMAQDDFEPDPRKHEFCEFYTEPGEMLFLPRYWAHRVTSMADNNVNLNWVWTSRQPNLRHAVGRRECATLKLRSYFGRLDRLVRYRVSIYNYGDGGVELFQRYASAVGRSQLFKTFCSELGRVALMPIFGSEVERQMQRMRDNNFPQSLSR